VVALVHRPRSARGHRRSTRLAELGPGETRCQGARSLGCVHGSQRGGGLGFLVTRL
jgi:hypothetical protein